MLLIVSPGFPGSEDETTCLPAIQQFILALSDIRGADNISIVTLQYPFKQKNYKWHDIQVYALGGENKKGLRRLNTWLNAWQVMNRLRKNNKIEGLLGLWLTEASLIAQYFGRLHGLQRYFWLQGQDAKQNNRYVKLIRPKPSQVLAISDFSKREFSDNHHIVPFLIAENGVRTSAFPPLNTNNRNIDILAAGSLIPLKNYDLFVEVIAGLVREFPTLKAVHVGEGPELARLQNKTAELGISDNLRFFGNTAHQEVLAFMNNSRLFIHTSSYEGSSTVISEALYSGCPVISTITLRDAQIQNFYFERDLTAIIKRASFILKHRAPVKRVLNRDIADTAKQINALFS